MAQEETTTCEREEAASLSTMQDAQAEATVAALLDDAHELERRTEMIAEEKDTNVVEPEAGIEVEPKTTCTSVKETTPEAEAEQEAEPEAETEAKRTTTEAEADVEAKTEAETKTEIEPNAERGAEPETEAVEEAMMEAEERTEVEALARCSR